VNQSFPHLPRSCPDTELPADWLVGRHFAWQAEHATECMRSAIPLPPLQVAVNDAIGTRLRAALRRVGIEPGQLVLEVGCGAGAFLRLITDRGAGLLAPPKR